MNITPSLVIELEAMGFSSLEDLEKIGWEKLCTTYVKNHSAALNPNFFTLLYAIVHNTPLRKVTKESIKKSEKLYKKIKTGFDPGFAKKSRKKT